MGPCRLFLEVFPCWCGLAIERKKIFSGTCWRTHEQLCCLRCSFSNFRSLTAETTSFVKSLSFVLLEMAVELHIFSAKWRNLLLPSLQIVAPQVWIFLTFDLDLFLVSYIDSHVFFLFCIYIESHSSCLFFHSSGFLLHLLLSSRDRCNVVCKV